MGGLLHALEHRRLPCMDSHSPAMVWVGGLGLAIYELVDFVSDENRYFCPP